MNVIDVVIFVMLAAAVAIETRRGFGKAVFDFAALLIAVRIVPLLVGPCASWMRLAKDSPANEAVWFAVLFVVVGAVLLYVAKLAYDSTLISVDTFEPALGGVMGFGIAVIVGHALVRSFAIAAGVSGVPPEALATSAFGMEFYRFTTYHKVIDFLVALPA